MCIFREGLQRSERGGTGKCKGVEWILGGNLIGYIQHFMKRLLCMVGLRKNARRDVIIGCKTSSGDIGQLSISVFSKER